MKKVFTNKWAMLTAASLLLAAVASGCGAGGKAETGDGGGGKAGSAGASDATAPKADKKYKVSWVTGQSTPVEPGAKMIKYWNEKLNVELDVWNIESKSYAEMMNLKFASGEIPDRMVVRGFASLQKYVDQDILAEIPLEMLKKYAPNVYAKTEKEFPNAFNYAKVEGKIYGIPQLVFYDRFRAPVVWRGDWLKNVGIAKTPETLDEFEQALYKIANEDPDKNGKKDTYGLSKSSIDVIYGAYGYNPTMWTKKGDALVYGAVQPEMKDALKLLNKWYKDGVVDPEFITGENTGGYALLSHAFINGRIGVSSLGRYYHWKPILFEGDGNSHNYLEVKKLNPQAADALVHGLPPKGPTGKMGAPQGSMLSGNFISFGKPLEKEPDKLAKVLQMIDTISASSYENYVTAMLGMKGEDWDYNAQNVPTFKKAITSQDLEKMGANNVIESLELPEFSAQRNAPNAKWAADAGYDKGGIRNELLTALPSQAKFQAELQKLQDQAYISIITGDKPLEYFDEFVKKWKSGGGEQMEKEANEWYSKLGK
ncbi:extracellular solute-binding protein [Paenibacillus flagellatus]|uniref:ABC transporter substrate-binding protein n=1 Tax=Paenibacillus flagellatus TaxID=2211139 RepID=A0A2V5KAV8_9BACL|nr:extracellular solute-binding protein [Paenibacillus flagellatus]PYI56628.1 ABC transporter substrate-binding protein [Paenibacillus flagellatus]